MGKYSELFDGEWHESEKRKLKKISLKEIRGELDPNLPIGEARRENRALRKQLARRKRRIEKRQLGMETF